MGMVLELAPLSAALEHIGQFVQFPVDATTSEVTSASAQPAAVRAGSCYLLQLQAARMRSLMMMKAFCWRMQTW